MAYPISVATDTDLHLAKNNLSTTLAGAIDSTTTTVILTDASSFPSAGFVTIESEIIQYTGISVNTLTGVTRGADGTPQAAHADLLPVNHFVIAAHHNALKDELIAVETELLAHFDLTGTPTVINNNVGVGIASPDGRFHIFTASAGAVTADTGADELVLEGSGDVGLSILGTGSSKLRLQFGKATGNDIAHVEFNNTLNTMSFFIDGANRVQISVGALLGSDGTAALPGISFISDPDTGIQRFGTDSLGISCGGTVTLRVVSPAALNATEVSIFVFDKDAALLRAVTVGADDSGGSGFKVLRIPN